MGIHCVSTGACRIFSISSTWKLMVGRLLSFWDGLFSWAFGSLIHLSIVLLCSWFGNPAEPAHMVKSRDPVTSFFLSQLLQDFHHQPYVSVQFACFWWLGNLRKKSARYFIPLTFFASSFLEIHPKVVLPWTSESTVSFRMLESLGQVKISSAPVKKNHRRLSDFGWKRWKYVKMLKVHHQLKCQVIGNNKKCHRPFSRSRVNAQMSHQLKMKLSLWKRSWNSAKQLVQQISLARDELSINSRITSHSQSCCRSFCTVMHFARRDAPNETKTLVWIFGEE